MSRSFVQSLGWIAAAWLAAVPLRAQHIPETRWTTPHVLAVGSPAVSADFSADSERMVASLEQQASPEQSTVGRMVRIGKWSLLGVAVGLGVYAVMHSREAEEHYETLRGICDNTASRCQVGPDGRYADPAAESTYQAAIRHDRQAQVGIVGGQISLLGSVALFIADLRNSRGPADIPYPTGSAAREVAIGVRLSH